VTSKRYRLLLHAALLGALLGLAGCAEPERPAPAFRIDPVRYADLPGWRNASQNEALAALRRSCSRMQGRGPNAALGTGWVPLKQTDWAGACGALPPATVSPDAARGFFEQYFRPYLVSGENGSEGLFTGYFEVEITGSRHRTAASQVPIYTLPKDHITVDLGRFDPALAGKRVVGRVEGRHLVPYHMRGDIDEGALAGKGAELIWADDPIDVFLLHIQGSGRVRLRDGSVVRIGYAGHNGHGYRSIGRVLIRRGELTRDGASWPHIRRWIETHPQKARALFAENPRYIFFRLIAGDGPVGAHGVALTPRRSLAVDARYIPYGVPVWLTTHWPNTPGRPLNRLMVAQDTGAAITGAVRGDFFWGHGREAADLAGTMKGRGRYYVLLPRTSF
jgi:membrane-bound lytic murein transglycosylase A